MSSEPFDEERFRRLLQSYRDQTLSLTEARELLSYIEEDLERARENAKPRTRRMIERYHRGVSAYIQLTEQGLLA